MATIGVVVGLVMGVWWVVWKLWNEIAAGVFGAPELTYWQTAGAMILLSLLTAGLRNISSKRD